VSAFRLESLSMAAGPLVRDALAGGPAAAWYAPVPREVGAWREAAAAARARVRSDWHGALGGALLAHGAAAERLARAAGHGVVVTTGQQPGLFGGPAFVWHKALTALALADAIEDTTGVPCAPVFWAATDDTDFAEAATTWVASARGAEALAVTARPADDTPMALAPLGDEVTQARAALDRHLGSVPWPPALAAGLAAYRPQATHGDAYVALLAAVLGPLGVTVLDAAHPAVGAASRAFLCAALARTSEVNAALERRAAEITTAGFPVQVPVLSALSLVFGWDDHGKRRIAADRDAAEAAGDRRLSPNVLLRPVAEAAILPTVAYVAGPGELAYFAQVSAVAQVLDRPVPVAVPRWTGRVVERRHDEQLTGLGATVDDLRDPHHVANRVARSAIPAREAKALASLRAAIADATNSLREAGGILPADAVAGAERQLAWRVDRLERRIAAAIKRRDADTQRRIAALQGHYWPMGVPQDRKLNLLPWFARFGAPLVDALRDATRAHAAAIVRGGPP
jgi:uncharacterized protein YllA (UPF0747 family)